MTQNNNEIDWKDEFDNQFRNIITAEYNERDRMHRPLQPSDPRGEIKVFIEALLASHEQKVREEIAREIEEMNIGDIPYLHSNQYREGFKKSVDLSSSIARGKK